jgi:hypothetical protein
MSKFTKVSVSVPTDLLHRAETKLMQLAEGRSAFFARLLDEAYTRALEDEYARGYAEQPVTDEQNSVSEAIAAQGFAALRAEEQAAGLPVPPMYSVRSKADAAR